MSNCLVTKLKGTADNSNLSYLGELRVECLEHENPTSNSTYIGVSGSGITAKVIHGSMTDSSHIASGSEVVFTPIYSITTLSASGSASKIRVVTPLDKFKYNNVITRIDDVVFNQQSLDDISDDFINNSLTTLKGRGIINGDISKLNKFTVLELAQFVNFQRGTGNIVDLGSHPTLNAFKVGAAYNPSIEGTVEDLAESLISHGRTSGTFILTKTIVPRRNQETTSYNSWKITLDSSLSGGYSIEGVNA